MEVNKKINGKRYHCRKVPVMKQLKLLPLLAPILDDDDDASQYDVDYEGLFKLLTEHSKLRCENIQLGEREVDELLLPYLDSHFEDIDELMSVMTWAMGVSFNKKDKDKDKE